MMNDECFCSSTIIHRYFWLPRSICISTDCVLLFGRTERGERGWAYPLPKSLSPGQEVPFDHLESQTVETFLTKRRIISSKDEAAGYDRAAFEVGRIVEVMMFHDRAGAS